MNEKNEKKKNNKKLGEHLVLYYLLGKYPDKYLYIYIYIFI